MNPRSPKRYKNTEELLYNALGKELHTCPIGLPHLETARYITSLLDKMGAFIVIPGESHDLSKIMDDMCPRVTTTTHVIAYTPHGTSIMLCQQSSKDSRHFSQQDEDNMRRFRRVEVARKLANALFDEPEESK